ncbi:MAG: tetratricopeptide repeat protein [Clostridium sp.]|nr:tetratricopeptide repeat protein [Acetatifactor muris]MCM1526179.1 tetratricopeptide repeat protein [Bacteroides sp.]MCM1562673.1 tetratricopeptide repeat protein [Clostridium sp.]
MNILRIVKKKILVPGALLAVLLLCGCDDANPKTTEAMQLLQGLNYTDALAGFDEAETEGENARLIARGRGIAYMGMADYENAIVRFEEALRGSDGFVQPIDYDLNYYLAAAYIKNGQPEEAEGIYDAILALRSEEEDAYFLRGNVRLSRDNYEGAKADFDKVISMDAANYDRIIEIYQALEHYGYGDVGRAYLESAMRDAGDKMNDYDSGRIHYYLGNYQQACVALEKSREKGGADSYLYLGKAYEATGDYNYAASVYNAWIAKDTGSAAIYNQLGLCEMVMGNYARALEAFRSGMQVENNSLMQTLSFNEIVAYEYLEEYQKALVLVENYLKSYPDDAQAVREQQFLSGR